MAQQIETAFVKQFEAEVHDAYQQTGSKLRNTVRLKESVVGASTTFQVAGKGLATTKARHGTIPPMNQDHTAVPCQLEDIYAGDWVDKLDELKINIDERGVLTRGGAAALGRANDDHILVAMAATTQANITIDTTSLATILDSMMKLVEALNSNDVPDDGQRWGVISPRAWTAVMLLDQFSNADYVGMDGMPFERGFGVRNWLNVNWMMHTGVPGVGTASESLFCYHKTAVGYGSGQGITTDISWHGDRAAHWIYSSMSGGACLIEDAGVIKGILNATVDLPTG